MAGLKSLDFDALSRNGQVDYLSRWVRTERYVLQEKARRSLFGRYRNRYTNDPSVEGASAIVLWLKTDSVRRLAADLAGVDDDTPIFLSSTLLGGTWDDLPPAIRDRARVVHLQSLPGEADPAMERFRAWAQKRRVATRYERHQALAYFACLTFGEGASQMSRIVSRDYLMDLLQHMSSLTAYLPLYLRGGITPGQRVLSRGGWVLDLSGRFEPAWVVP